MTRDGMRSRLAATAAYAGIWLGAAVLFLLIRSYGEGLHVAGTASAGPHVGIAGDRPNAVLHILLALATVVALGRLLARVCRLVGQPPVIGEVIAGILLGPSLLGQL